MKYYSDKTSLKILSVINTLIMICIITVIKYLLYYISENFSAFETAAEIVAAILIIAYAFFSFVILPLWHRSLCYTILADEMILRSGVIFKNSIHVKISAIQYTTVVKCPVSSKINFNFLLMHVYGGRLVLMFLSLQNLAEINKIILVSAEDKRSF